MFESKELESVKSVIRVSSLCRAVQQLGEGNHNRFVKLKEVANEQSEGNRESDLDGLKKLFSSVKNTFIHYDVKNSFLEGDRCAWYSPTELLLVLNIGHPPGLSQGFPDGSESDRFAASEGSVTVQAEGLKGQKQTNANVLTMCLGLCFFVLG